MFVVAFSTAKFYIPFRCKPSPKQSKLERLPSALCSFGIQSRNDLYTKTSTYNKINRREDMSEERRLIYCFNSACIEIHDQSLSQR